MKQLRDQFPSRARLRTSPRSHATGPTPHGGWALAQHPGVAPIRTRRTGSDGDFPGRSAARGDRTTYLECASADAARGRDHAARSSGLRQPKSRTNWIECREEGGVDRHRLPQRSQDLEAKGARVEVGVAQPDDVLTRALTERPSRHLAGQCRRDSADETPQISGVQARRAAAAETAVRSPIGR